jgi:hypothetical protein
LRSAPPLSERRRHRRGAQRHLKILKHVFLLIRPTGLTMLVDRVVEIARNSTTVPGSTCDDIHHRRTLLNIILSCASMIFLCAWVALHLDVPDNPHEIGWKRGLLGGLQAKRIVIMPLATFVPEVILYLAFTQWIESSEMLTRIMRKQRITFTQSILLNDSADQINIRKLKYMRSY